MTIGNWLHDLSHAARTLRRTPAFSLTAIGMLALAMGATAGMFNVVNTVLLAPLPFANPDRLVHIAASAPGSQLPPEFDAADEFFVQYTEQSKQLVDISTYNSFTNTLRVADRVERIRMSLPTNSMYSTLGVAPALGRLPVEADEHRAVVISDALWTTWFARDPTVIGRTIQIGAESASVIGVMGPDFRFPNADTMLWISGTLRATDIKTPGDFSSPLIARLADGATPESAAKELTALARRLPERFGGSPAYARTMEHHRAVVRPLGEHLVRGVSRPLWILLGAAVIVLLIACANVANLFLVRAEGRYREMAMRRALGAASGQLIRLQMTETFIVAGVAGVLALFLAAVVLPGFLRIAPPRIPRLEQVHIDLFTVLFTLISTLLSALLCGGLPALRGSAPDLTRLREGGRGMTGQRHLLRNALVVGQTALSLVLLIGSGLLVRSAYLLSQTDPGYDVRDVFTFQIAPERPQLKDAVTYARFDLAFLDRLNALPGVQSVGLIENVPLNESTASMRFRAETNAGARDDGVLLNFNYTAGDYFKTMGIALLQGRTFVADDHGTSLGNVIVSRSAAARLWPGQDPIGKRIRRERQNEWETVVGVVDDVKQNDMREVAQAAVYFPLVGPMENGGRSISSPAYVVKSARAATIAADIRALAREVAPEAPMYRTYTLSALLMDSMAQLSFTLITLAFAALLSLVLGAVGLYGVLSCIVAERTREIGVRMALGAHAREVRRMVVAHGVRVIGAGVGIGLFTALACARALGALLFGVKPFDPTTFAAMAAAMVAVGLLASYLPARRASNLDPIAALTRD